jgi:hypothetical protein
MTSSFRSEYYCVTGIQFIFLRGRRERKVLLVNAEAFMHKGQKLTFSSIATHDYVLGILLSVSLFTIVNGSIFRSAPFSFRKSLLSSSCPSLTVILFVLHQPD